jgi:hypothetical protein
LILNTAWVVSVQPLTVVGTTVMETVQEDAGKQLNQAGLVRLRFPGPTLAAVFLSRFDCVSSESLNAGSDILFVAAPPTERVWRDRCRVQRFTIQTAEEWSLSVDATGATHSSVLWILFLLLLWCTRAKSNDACLVGSQADPHLMESDHLMSTMEESFWAHARLRSRQTMSVLVEHGSTAVQGAMTKRLDGMLLSMQACLNHLGAGLPPPAAASVLSTVMDIPDDVAGLLENPPYVSDGSDSDEDVTLTLDGSSETAGPYRPLALPYASANP